MDGEAGWWTTSGKIGLPPLTRAMGVGRQQQHDTTGNLDIVGGEKSSMSDVDKRMGFIERGKKVGVTGYISNDLYRQHIDGEIPKASNSTFGNCSGEGKNCPILLIPY